MLVAIAMPFIRLACRLTWSSAYLTGRHFEGSNNGWRWAWRGIWLQKVLGFNRDVPWPISPSSRILHPGSIEFHPDDLNNFQSHGCYYANSADGKITIGRGTYIAPNVGIITTNHNPQNPAEHLPPQDVKVGKQCWIGMNAVILPGVVLGDHTVVAAGSVVGRSYPKGNVVLVGVPARVSQQIAETALAADAPTAERGEPE